MCDIREIINYQDNKEAEGNKLIMHKEEYPDRMPEDTLFHRLNNYILNQRFAEHVKIHGIRDRIKNHQYILDLNWGYDVYLDLYKYLRKAHGKVEGQKIFLYIRWGKKWKS